MSIIKLESKNIKTLAVMTLASAIGTVLLTWFTKAGYFTYGFDTGMLPSPYIAAFQPILYVALPILLVISFVFGIIVATREELPIARWQAAVFTVIAVIFAYIVSFMLVSQGI